MTYRSGAALPAAAEPAAKPAAFSKRDVFQTPKKALWLRCSPALLASKDEEGDITSTKNPFAVLASLTDAEEAGVDTMEDASECVPLAPAPPAMRARPHSATSATTTTTTATKARTRPSRETSEKRPPRCFVFTHDPTPF